MYSRFHYILIGLITVVVYLIYLIGYYKVQEYETDSFTRLLISQSEGVEKRNKDKEFLASLIRTPAYATMLAKATQNKKLPGEEVINIVTEEEVSGNADLDARSVIIDSKRETEDPTRGMTNAQKWWWMMSNMRGG